MMCTWLMVHVLAACDVTQDTSLIDTIPTNESASCDDNSDCPDGSTCDEQLRQCLSATSDQRDVHLLLEVLPPSEDGTPSASGATVVGPIALDPRIVRDVTLKKSVSVFGTVNTPFPDLELRGDLSFRPQTDVSGSNDLLGLAVRAAFAQNAAEASVSAEPVPAQDEQEADFGVKLLSDTTYQLLFEPLGSSAQQLPPTDRLFTVSNDQAFQRENLNYPTQFPEYRGTLVDENGDPVDGMRVQAIQAGTVVSSISVSGSLGQSGVFTLALDPFAIDFELRVSPNSEEALFPTMILPAEDKNEAGVEVELPTFSQVTFAGRVMQTNGDAVERADLTFRSLSLEEDPTDGDASLTTSVSTSSVGTFTATLLPGIYDLDITPPGSGPDLQIVTDTVEVSETVSGVVYDVFASTVFSGQVRTQAGAAVGGAQVQAIAIRPTATTSDITDFGSNRSVEGKTEPEGTFALPVESGPYDVVVRPPGGSDLPWIVLLDAPISSPNNDGAFDLVFSASSRISGVVSQQNDEGVTEPVGGAVIRVRAIIEERVTSAAGQYESARIVPVGEGTTDEDGSYIVNLPVL